MNQGKTIALSRRATQRACQGVGIRIFLKIKYPDDNV